MVKYLHQQIFILYSNLSEKNSQIVKLLQQKYV